MPTHTNAQRAPGDPSVPPAIPAAVIRRSRLRGGRRRSAHFVTVSVNRTRDHTAPRLTTDRTGSDHTRTTHGPGRLDRREGDAWTGEKGRRVGGGRWPAAAADGRGTGACEKWGSGNAGRPIKGNRSRQIGTRRSPIDKKLRWKRHSGCRKEWILRDVQKQNTPVS